MPHEKVKAADTPRLLRLKDVLKLTGLSATTIWGKKIPAFFRPA
jgi:predicted DNA-binding transcriptional regulator AlpA